MVTSAPGRRLAHGLVALALAVPAVLFGGVAWAEPTPTPAPDQVAVDAAPATQTPLVQPSIGTWIIGGTLLEGAGQPAKPAAKPATKPAAKPPAAQPPALAPTRRVTHTHASTPASTRTSAAAAPTALPFTGGHAQTLLPVGIVLLVGGLALTLLARPRRALVAG